MVLESIKALMPSFWRFSWLIDKILLVYNIFVIILDFMLVLFKWHLPLCKVLFEDNRTRLLEAFEIRLDEWEPFNSTLFDKQTYRGNENFNHMHTVVLLSENETLRELTTILKNSRSIRCLHPLHCFFNAKTIGYVIEWAVLLAYRPINCQ